MIRPPQPFGRTATGNTPSTKLRDEVAAPHSLSLALI
jgi:hypothetical protein